MFIDTHTHLNSEQFDADRNDVIQRAIRDGVSRFYIPNVDLASIAGMHALENAFPNHCFGMMGLHPCSVGADWEAVLATMKEYLDQRSYVAIGEIGIDLYWDKTHLTQQKDAFRKQIQLAKRYKLPIVIHCREAFDEIFEILEEEKSADLFGIFHCFSGTYEQALQAISYNMKLGIGGIVTFKNGKIDHFLNQIDLKHLVLETDSPYLAPVPFRGKRNESSYLVTVVRKLSEIYNLPKEEIARITTENSITLFGI